MSSGRRLAAIVFTDLEGFTSLTQRDERGALALLEEQRGLVDAALATRGGRLIKSMGDGLLLEFPNARDAVEGAVELQRSVRARNLREADRPLRLRIGIHLGDVEERGSDILGDAVNIASRIEPLAEAGGICCSAQVHEQVRNKVPVTWQRLGPRALKGVDAPVEIYRVGWGEPAETAAPKPAPARAGPPRIAVLPLVAGVSYEVLQFNAQHLDFPLVRAMTVPGMLLQRLTTRQPSDDQVEVAIRALQGAIAMDEEAERE